MANNVKEKFLYSKIPLWNYKEVNEPHIENITMLDSATEEDIISITDLCPCGSGKEYYLCHGKYAKNFR